MKMILISSYTRSGVRHLSAGFPTEEAASAFLQAELGALARRGSTYIVVSEASGRTERTYLTARLLECIHSPDWYDAGKMPV